MKLQSKAGDWKYSSVQWILPNEGEEGFIEDRLSGKVLELENSISCGSFVVLETLPSSPPN